MPDEKINSQETENSESVVQAVVAPEEKEKPEPMPVHGYDRDLPEGETGWRYSTPAREACTIKVDEAHFVRVERWPAYVGQEDFRGYTEFWLHKKQGSGTCFHTCMTTSPDFLDEAERILETVRKEKMAESVFAMVANTHYNRSKKVATEETD